MMDIFRKSLTKFKEEQRRVRDEVRQRTVGYIVAALGLVAGLAWNDAIKTVIEYAFPINGNNILAKLVYAVLVTVVIVLVSVYLMRLAGEGAEAKK